MLALVGGAPPPVCRWLHQPHLALLLLRLRLLPLLLPLCLLLLLLLRLLLTGVAAGRRRLAGVAAVVPQLLLVQHAVAVGAQQRGRLAHAPRQAWLCLLCGSGSSGAAAARGLRLGRPSAATAPAAPAGGPRCGSRCGSRATRHGLLLAAREGRGGREEGSGLEWVPARPRRLSDCTGGPAEVVGRASGPRGGPCPKRQVRGAICRLAPPSHLFTASAGFGRRRDVKN